MIVSCFYKTFDNKVMFKNYQHFTPVSGQGQVQGHRKKKNPEIVCFFPHNLYLK